jgi:plasmid stabilization system protein ParE
LKITLSPAARETVRAEAYYLRSKSPRAAQQFADDLKRLRQNISRFPEMGRTTEELPVPGVLRFVMGVYLVDYAIRDDEVVIFAIRHGRERPPGVELGDDFDYENAGEHS